MSTQTQGTAMQNAASSRHTSSAAINADTSRDETRSLIAASKVNGTNVYNRQGDSLGSIYDVMIDKPSGKVDYAIMAFGGFLGMGQNYHPLPWHVLTYDEHLGGYVTDLDPKYLQGGPAYASSDTPDWGSGEYGRQVDDYYARSTPGLGL